MSVYVFVCVSVCLSASMSLEPLDRSTRNSVRRSPLAVARFSSGGAALHYVLLVLWMMSRLAVIVSMALHRWPDLLLAVTYEHDWGRVMSMNACCNCYYGISVYD